MTSFEPEEEGSSPLHAAVQRLLELLDGLPPFDPCRGPVESWTEGVRSNYLPVWALWPTHLQIAPPQRIKETWWAYGKGSLLMLAPAAFPVFSDVPGSATPDLQPTIQRVLDSRANSMPEHVRETIIGTWRATRGGEPQVVIRNEWHERREAVARIRPEIDLVIPGANRAITRAGGDLSVLRALAKDDVLHHETVDAAVAQLNRVLPPAKISSVQASLAIGSRPLMTGREAATIIGVRESTLSQWQAKVPAWAQGNAALFKHLIDRDDGRYTRHNVRKLASWYEVAMNQGGQAPVDCP
jgi:hypothetical protein